MTDWRLKTSVGKLFQFPRPLCYSSRVANTEESPRRDATQDAHFLTTHWSAVVRAGQTDAREAAAALAELCQNYWYPLYAFVRRQGRTPPEAEDLTQEFFAQLLAKNFVAKADQDKGRFRSFLLTLFKRFLANEWNRQHAQKRSGFQAVVSIDADLAESRLGAEPAHAELPDAAFERQWAMTLLERVMGRLQREYVESGRAKLFEQLEACLVRGESALPYAQIAARLNLTEAAIKMAVQRLRARYRELLREEISHTVATPDQVDEEIRHLFAAFRR